MNVLVQIDYRTQRLNYKHYKDKGLKPVSCLVLALLLTTGRRLKEVATLTWPQFKQGESPRLELKKTKTSRKNNKLVFKIR